MNGSQISSELPATPPAADDVEEIRADELEPSVDAPPVRMPPPAHPVGASERHAWEFHAIWLALSLAVLCLAAVLSIRGEQDVVVPLVNRALPGLCHMKRFTGLDCPGCGLTRCFISLAHGDLAAAWHFNAAGILLFAAVAVQVPFRAGQLWRQRRGLPPWRVPGMNVAIAVIVAALFVHWFWRLYQTAVAWSA